MATIKIKQIGSPIRRPAEQLDLADMAAALRKFIRELPPVSTRLVDAEAELLAALSRADRERVATLLRKLSLGFDHGLDKA